MYLNKQKGSLALIAVGAIAATLILAGIAWKINAYGDSRFEAGREAEKAVWTAEQAKQKDETARTLASAHEKVRVALAERDKARANREKEHVTASVKTDTDRVDLAGVGLRLSVPSRAITFGNSPANSAKGGTPGTEASAIVQLPAVLTSDLRQLTFLADQVRVDYARCLQELAK